MNKYEYCIICAERYRQRGNFRMYRKYRIFAMNIRLNEVGEW